MTTKTTLTKTPWRKSVMITATCPPRRRRERRRRAGTIITSGKVGTSRPEQRRTSAGQAAEVDEEARAHRGEDPEVDDAGEERDQPGEDAEAPAVAHLEELAPASAPASGGSGRSPSRRRRGPVTTTLIVKPHHVMVKPAT